MGPEALKAIAEVLQIAGGYGFAAVFAWLYLRERAANQKTTDRLLDDGVKRTEAQVAHTITLGGVKDVITKLQDILFTNRRDDKRGE